jgi:ubiquinone/menaquinone biosynthesis C-methylase UbiE
VLHSAFDAKPFFCSDRCPPHRCLGVKSTYISATSKKRSATLKICANCSARYDRPNWDCPACSFKPDRAASHIRFAPDVATETAGFEPEFFESLFTLEASNFWFRARNELILWAMKRYFSTAGSMLEIGCGTGFVLSGIEQAFPQLTLAGTEVLDRGLELTAKRIKTAMLYQMDARSIPFENEFDVIGAFDVIEHIVEDSRVLGEMYRAVKPGGGILVTVPQHPWLWSQGDVHAHHERRYVGKEFAQLLRATGFRISRMTSFVSLLLPLLLISRRRNVGASFNPHAEFQIPVYQNSILEWALGIERSLIQSGVNFAAGGSLLVIAHKPESTG